ncbi:hypothetical protein Tco_1277918 [Tanacetum coccineum]
MFQKQKRSKKHMDYEQVINVLAMEKSRLEEELSVTKSKLKLHDRYLLKRQVAKQMQDANACSKANTCSKCLLQQLASKQILLAAKQILVANGCCSSLQKSKFLLQRKVNAANENANSCCKCNQINNILVVAMASKWVSLDAASTCCMVSNLQLQDANPSCQCNLQMQAANACLQMQVANASCKCNLQTQDANASCKCKLPMQHANASSQMQAANACLQMQAANACL